MACTAACLLSPSPATNPSLGLLRASIFGFCADLAIDFTWRGAKFLGEYLIQIRGKSYVHYRPSRKSGDVRRRNHGFNSRFRTFRSCARRPPNFRYHEPSRQDRGGPGYEPLPNCYSALRTTCKLLAARPNAGAPALAHSAKRARHFNAKKRSVSCRFVLPGRCRGELRSVARRLSTSQRHMSRRQLLGQPLGLSEGSFGQRFHPSR